MHAYIYAHNKSAAKIRKKNDIRKFICQILQNFFLLHRKLPFCQPIWLRHAICPTYDNI